MMDKLATNVKFRTLFLLFGVVIALIVGILTNSLGWAVLVVSMCSIVVGVSKIRHTE